ncbi:MAG: carboxypeptidase regulatory-like domain-containing protein [archaeon]|nr:carboxypeptidase regulatory-like domain-containing protein [archaeon]
MEEPQERVTGLVNGEVIMEIPNSYYFYSSRTVTIFFPNDSYAAEIVGTGEGTYGLEATSVENGEVTTFAIINASTNVNVTHQYLINWTAYSKREEGVTLKMDSDGDGIFEETTIIQPPIALFTYSPENPIVNQSITSDASTSYDPDGDIKNYIWHFGDGNITSTTGATITYSYSSAGNYEVKLTVTDDEGVSNLIFKVITISRPPQDLALNTTDIVFSNDNPILGENVTISATIHNIGEANAEDAFVAFYDGEPESGTIIGWDTIDVPAGGTADASVIWNAATPGLHEIYVVAEVGGFTSDIDATNNIANRMINVRETVVTGTVTDYNGDPVPDAYILAIGPITTSTITDINGTYRITRLQSGSYTIRVEPINPNLMTASTSISITAGQTVVRNFTLQAAGSIAGNVTDVNGTGISDIIVYLSGYETARYRTDENGRYVIPRLQAGTYTVNVDASETDFEDNSTTVVVTLGQTTIADFVLQKFQGGSIAGRVTDVNGMGVSNARVVASGPSYEDGYTNETGYYAIRRLLVGNYTVIAYPPYGSNLVSNSTTASVALGETTIVDLILREGGIIAGRVTDANGTGIYNSYVYASGPSYGYDYTNETGYYSIAGLLAGNYTVTAYPPYGTDLLSNSTTASVTLGETTVVDFVLHPPPDIWIYPLYFNVTLSQGNVTNRTLTIGNNGTGVLEFGIADDALIITDPNEGTLADIKNVYAGVSTTHVNFRVGTYTSMTEAWGYVWLDTDQNSSTGATADIYPGYGLNDIGAEYLVYMDLYSKDASLYRWADYGFEFVSYLPLNLNAYHFTFSMPLSEIADDGIMDVTLMMADYYGGIDIAPDEGHGSIGIGADWLSESPLSGTVEPDNQTEITVTINATDLEVGEYSASIIINSNDIDEGTVVIPVYLTVEEAEDTTPPTIISVTLDAYTTIPNATIHVTVEATDNIGVTSVTANGVNLVETGSIWEGDITAPSTTGDYTLTIRAEDAAGNSAETTVDYSVVKPSGSIGIGVDPRLTTVSAGDTAVINIKLVGTENFDDIAYVYLTTEGVDPLYKANLTWFNWTSKYVKVPAGGEVKVPLEVSIPGGESGYKVFYAKLESTKWTPTAMDTGVLYII